MNTGNRKSKSNQYSLQLQRANSFFFGNSEIWITAAISLPSLWSKDSIPVGLKFLLQL